MQYLEDEEGHSLKERNQAVWALGQIGDPSALPLLKKYYTGEECRHDKFLCQWELEKAISLTDGGFNATAWMWRKDFRLKNPLYSEILEGSVPAKDSTHY